MTPTRHLRAPVSAGLLACGLAAVTGLFADNPVHAQASSDLLTRVGRYVEAYYGRAQSLLALEAVSLQPLRHDFSPEGFPRRLDYELRIEWDPTASPQATVMRELVRLNGRPPRVKDEPECIDPRASSPEALAPLLPANQPGYRFRELGPGAVDGRRAIQLEFVQFPSSAPVVEWTDDCARVDLPGRVRTRIWVDASSGEILRFEEHLVGWVDVPVPRDRRRFNGPPAMTIERADTTIRFAPVRFSDPDEEWLLPSRVESLVVIRDSGTPRMRITQAFSNYRRFVTATRVLP